MKVGSIVVKCKKFDEILAFWQAALHYVPIRPPKDGWVILRDPEGRGPNLSLDKALDDERVGSTRCPRLHLDLYADDQEGEVNRLLGIGATRHPQTYDPEDDFIVLEDPDGNLFCVVKTYHERENSARKRWRAQSPRQGTKRGLRLRPISLVASLFSFFVFLLFLSWSLVSSCYFPCSKQSPYPIN